ncbi:MAG: putative DNA binding domain-containing protein [Prevotellaceae bacterium]|jgi:ATP-dependent DNA helicase RecG|nr:putative DNA binding domain-containing protein [Prevotellaceae bacterium]
MQLKETQHIEFKPGFNNDVIETLVAFANTKGGKVFIGVDNNGKPIKNFTIGKESIQNWINEIKTKTQQQIIPDWEIVKMQNVDVVTFSIQEYPIKPVSCRGKYFKRVNNSNHLLSVTEVVNMHLQTLNVSWDAYPDTGHSLDDISFEKVQNAIEIQKSNHLTINESPLPFLLKNDLIRDEKPVNAALLMFKNKESVETTIELGRFKTPIAILDTSRTQSDIITQVNQVLDFVRKHINVEIIITGEPQNIQKWQYPYEAIREIVLNMIIHRDYRLPYDSIVKIFDNKIEFYNPGKLPESMDIDDLFSGNYKSTPRNRKVADFFKNLGWIEKYGSGIGRIRAYFKEAKLPEPEFRLISEGFQVTVFLPENAAKKTTRKTTQKTTRKTTREILQAIKQKPEITRSELSEIVGISEDGIKWNLANLKTRGVIERIGADKGGYWKIIK